MTRWMSGGLVEVRARCGDGLLVVSGSAMRCGAVGWWRVIRQMQGGPLMAGDRRCGAVASW